MAIQAPAIPEKHTPAIASTCTTLPASSLLRIAHDLEPSPVKVAGSALHCETKLLRRSDASCRSTGAVQKRTASLPRDVPLSGWRFIGGNVVLIHAAIWIDHKEARVFHVHPDATDGEIIARAKTCFIASDRMG
jgi:hypothetical protein